ncbi:MAG: hypothetical protein ACRELE_04315 [Gemmatimonadales bacterium]
MPVPLGTIQALCPPLEIANRGVVTHLMRRCPWAPLALICFTDTARTLTGLPDHEFAVQCHGNDAYDIGSAIDRAARARAVPTGQQIAAYVAARVPTLGRWFFDALACEQWKANRVRRALQRLGGWTPAACRCVARCVVALSYAARPGASQQLGADAEHVDCKTLSRWTADLLGLGHQAAVELRCWEARVEAALRRAGYPLEINR